MNKKERGNWGEAQAVAFLEKKGYTIIERNYRSSAGGEIDIIARTGDRLVFVEVKVLSTYRREELGRIVGRRKQQRIRDAAGAFLQVRREFGEWRLRCDVMLVVPPGSEIVHWENAF